MQRKIQVRQNKEKIEYDQVQKRYYTETNSVVYEDWRINCHNAIFTELLSKGKKIPTKGTFVRYQPRHVNQLLYTLHLMACDKCTEFKWWFQAIINFLCKAHNCGKITCSNYDASMGATCKCDHCKNCLIFELKKFDPYDLMDHLLCRSFSTHHFLSCAKGICADSDCGTGRVKALLSDGTGCHTFNGRSESDVAFKFIDSYQVGDKSYKCASWDSESYDNFRMRFIHKLKEYLHHQFIKRKQYYERKILFTKDENGNYRFPNNWVWISIDFISNYHIKDKIITHGMGTKLAEVSHLVVHEKRIVNNQIQEKAYNYLSDQNKHGWFSAIPALYDYMTRTKTLCAKENVDVKLFVLWSDRGSKDFWNAPCHTYLSDIVKKTGVPIQPNTTESGHGKAFHDQIGGTSQSHFNRSTGNGKLKIHSNKSKSKQLCVFANKTFSKSKSGSITRKFINIPYQSIYTKGSPVSSLDIDGVGITKYQSAYIDGQRLRYRPVSCTCSVCIGCRYKRQCRQSSYCGKWSSWVDIEPHIGYGRLAMNQHNKNTNNNNNNDNNNHNNSSNRQ